VVELDESTIKELNSEVLSAEIPDFGDYQRGCWNRKLRLLPVTARFAKSTIQRTHLKSVKSLVAKRHSRELERRVKVKI
jgi:hypothetical protein